jgi:hypothetical protein
MACDQILIDPLSREAFLDSQGDLGQVNLAETAATSAGAGGAEWLVLRAPRYRATVSRFTASSRAIRRPDQPLRANALIASQMLTQRWFICPHEPNNRARSAMNLFTSDSGWFATALDWLVLTAR